jgi:hypothetical protein
MEEDEGTVSREEREMNREFADQEFAVDVSDQLKKMTAKAEVKQIIINDRDLELLMRELCITRQQAIHRLKLTEGCLRKALLAAVHE